MRYEWDLKKARLNEKKHGVSFEEARLIFEGPYDLSPDTSSDEERFIAVGKIKSVLVVVFCYRVFDTIRIISARKATRKERKTYEERI